MTLYLVARVPTRINKILYRNEILNVFIYVTLVYVSIIYLIDYKVIHFFVRNQKQFFFYLLLFYRYFSFFKS